MVARRFPPPFPYFGGKSQVTQIVWERFGDVQNYVEPFAGSLAVLLERPHWPWEGNRIETVNDADCFLANFWRALQCDPEGVAHHADWPVNEADLHARHFYLVNVGQAQIDRIRSDPDFYDSKIAGWWVWGLCQWIGGGWCKQAFKTRPYLTGAGRGVCRPAQQRPHLRDCGVGVHRATNCDLVSYLTRLAERLRKVRVVCGDWSRVCGQSGTGMDRMTTAVFLDPPYTAAANRDHRLYNTDCLQVGRSVRDWAVERGDDPRLRIALCGYEGEYKMPKRWECVAWKARGGYALTGNNKGKTNAHKERIWFSPHCLDPLTSSPRSFRRKSRSAQ
jgi:site-specific DNA-adenine methylase